MTSLKEMADYGAAQTGLPSREICSWWYAENGKEWPSNNNPGNISYLGEGVPESLGCYQGVNGKNEKNNVVSYDTPEDGVNAWIYLLNESKASKPLTLDLNDLLACKTVEEFTQTIGDSNWASSHYRPMGADGEYFGTPGETIMGAYHNDVISAWYASEAPASNVSEATQPVAAPETNAAHVYFVKAGDTLTKVSLEYRVPVAVIAAYNGIENPNFIEVGQQIDIPHCYVVRPGDTFNALAKKFNTTAQTLEAVNGHINPYRLMAFSNLYY